MNIIHSIILSVVEGLTEFLPVSSTGHLILASDLLKITQTDFVKSFEIIIQLGAILAVVFLYFKKLISGLEIWKKLIVAFLPAGVLGFIFYGIIKRLLIGNTMVVLVSLFLGGLALLALEYFYKNKSPITHHSSTISYRQALLIGVFQTLSMIPGVSRAAATIAGGMLVGLKRKTATEFSFLLAIPTMAAATGLDLLKVGFNFTGQETMILIIGFAGAFISAILAVKFLINYVKTHTFNSFAIYRIVLALVFLLFYNL
jgi:undecaprenyl-diphosphatase